MQGKKQIAVIGAGVAGCLVARMLADRGRQVQVFDKSRGTGGRLASARLGELSADLGAAMIDTDVAERLLTLDPGLPLQSWHFRQANLLSKAATDAQAWVSTPRASALTRSLLTGIPLHSQTRITELSQGDDESWWLHTEQGEQHGPFTHVVVAVPAPQAVPLLASAPELQQAAEAVQVTPTWVLLVELATRPAGLAETDFLDGNPDAEHPLLARVVRDSSKPGRSGEVWQLQARADWSQQHQSDPAEQVAASLLDAFADLAGESLQPVQHRVHRWLYADVAAAAAITNPLAPSGTLGICGDWVCGHGRCEQGLSAAVQSAEQLIRALEASDSALVD
jgi:predicted NAD/FAD-dependent oxidoreductase